MANIQSAKKRARQAVVRRGRNASQRSFFRNQIKQVILAIQNGDKTAAQSAYENAIPVIDRMANKGLIHRNKAARHKSRLNKQILALA
ncbi:MAG: 30S ribosomal protein S20 [Gammaproteobacteria bacterium]|nr:30S ribosomal protein S20 [Gammaproteobacteria bacterium]